MQRTVRHHYRPDIGPRNGTPGESRGRKATGLPPSSQPMGMAAELPNGPHRERGPTMRRLSILLIGLITGMSVLLHSAAQPAAAGMSWCWGDPTLVIAGQAVHIDVGVQ